MKMKQVFVSTLLVLGLHGQAMAANMPAKEASKRIEQVVKIISPLAQSQVRGYKVKPDSSVRSALLELAMKEDYLDDAADFTWVGKSLAAWDADSGNWGEATMKDAYDYITYLDTDSARDLSEAEAAKIEGQIQKAKKSFKLLLNTGVRFGVVPMGAVQCGVTFAGLAIIDPHTGKVFVFAKEGSGC